MIFYHYSIYYFTLISTAQPSIPTSCQSPPLQPHDVIVIAYYLHHQRPHNHHISATTSTGLHRTTTSSNYHFHYQRLYIRGTSLESPTHRSMSVHSPTHSISPYRLVPTELKGIISGFVEQGVHYT